MPASEVPGERAFPTQPIPVKPPALARVGYSPSDLVTADDTTPEHARACADLLSTLGGVSNAGPFTPWGMKPTLLFPGTLGGANWGGAAFDPTNGFIIVATQDVGAIGMMAPAKDGSPVPLREGVAGPLDVRRARSATQTGPARNRHGDSSLP